MKISSSALDTNARANQMKSCVEKAPLELQRAKTSCPTKGHPVLDITTAFSGKRDERGSLA